MFSSVPWLFRISAWRTGLQMFGPISQHSGSMPTSVFGTMPVLQEAPNTSNPLERRIPARVLASSRSPRQLAIPILLNPMRFANSIVSWTLHHLRYPSCSTVAATLIILPSRPSP